MAKDKSRNKFCEKVRIVVAQKIDIPPDDVDMSSILDCVERAIQISCEKENGEMLISFKNKDEEKAILSDYGETTLSMIFSNEPPFDDFVSDYQEWFASKVLKSIYDKRI